MDPDWVVTWLRELNLSEYQDNFCNNGYRTHEECLEIEKEDLKRIDIVKVGHVNRLYRAVEKLRSDSRLSPQIQSPLENTDTTSPHRPAISTLLSPTGASGSLSNSGSRAPPPVPMRRSLRRKEPSSPTKSSVEGALPPSSQGVQATLDVGSPPPPVLPRQQSLKTVTKPQSALNIKIRKRASTEGEGCEDFQKPEESELSPIPQSPAVLTGGESNQTSTQFPLEQFQTVGQNREPPQQIPLVVSAAATATENHLPPCPSDPDDNPVLAVAQEPEMPPKPSPRPVTKQKSLGKPPPPPVRKESDPALLAPAKPSPRDDSTGQQVSAHLNGGSESRELSESFNRIQSPTSDTAPALPPKTKRIIIPTGDVVFELENEPMPPLDEGNRTQNGLPPMLPPKDVGVPKFTPPPPPRTQGPPPPPRVSTLMKGSSLASSAPAPMQQPPLPSKDPGVPNFKPPPPVQQLPLPSKDPGVPNFKPPPPVQQLPLPSKDPGVPNFKPPPPVQQLPLPSKDPGVPNFKPPPPPPQAELANPPPLDLPLRDSPPSGDAGTRSGLSPPVLPPKDVVFPPPPPPITEEDFPEDDDDDSEEEQGPLMSISSSSLGVNRDSILLVSDGGVESTSDSPSPISSPEPTSGTLIRQQPSPGANLDDIILVSQSPNPDYMNDEALFSKTRDYANQDAIDETIQIHGTSPIKSRTLYCDTDLDYENQEVLDGDIIPLSVLPPESPSHLSLTKQDGMDISPNNSPALQPKQTSRLTQGSGQHTQDVLPDWTVSSSNERTPVIQPPPRHPARDGQNASVRNTTGTARPRPVKPVPKPRSQTHGFAPGAEEGSDARRTPEISVGGGSSTRGGISDRGQQPRVRSVYSTLGAGEPGRNLSSSVPKTSTDVFDGPISATVRLLTFAGSGTRKQTSPVFKKSISVPTVLEDERNSIIPMHSRLDSANLQEVPRFKEGYLHKKGGKKSERPWQKRWVTFDGDELKYFKNKGDKESESKNTVRLGEMIDIKKVTDQDKQNRFDLVVINRVFQFFADTPEDCQSWVSVLHAAISRFRPQDHEFKEGGNMHSPDKQGFLLKQGHGLRSGFRERYIALKGSKFAYYESKEDFVQAKPIHILEMSLSNVRPDMSGKCRFTVTMTNQKSYVFQAANEQERHDWIEVLTNAILTGLDKRPQTLTRGKTTTSRDIMEKLQENPSNKICADCAASDPSWGVVNRGMMVCINCSGVHRSMGTHISKVRSLELDLHIWTDTLIKLMQEIGNDNGNSFWEKHWSGERLPADVEREIRESFIRSKYQTKSWIPIPTGESKEALNKLLCISVGNGNLMRTVELLVHGADPCYTVKDASDPEINSVLGIARAKGQELQTELLEQNGALICSVDNSPTLTHWSKKGHLFKTGSDRTGWKRRWCTLDQYKGFAYFKSETDSEKLGDIQVEEMLGVSKCEEDSARDPRYPYCFEVNTESRGYLLCADSEEELTEWIRIFSQIIPADAADRLGYEKVGYLRKRDPHNVGGWKRRWFTLKGKKLCYNRREHEETSVVDLRKVIELKGPDASGTPEAQSSFQVVLPERTYNLRAETPQDADQWLSALKHTQVSGIPLEKQQLTSTGLPIIVHKCLQFIESHGMDIEGLYRLSGEKAKMRKLVLAFNQDARGVQIDSESFIVHDVTGTLKQFFRSLPDPLLTHQMYEAFIAAVQSSDHEQQLYQLQSLIEQLPEVNRETLKRVIGHLTKVIEHESKNKMSRKNLVRLFGPTLMTVDDDPMSFTNTQWEYSCIDTMIQYYKWLFGVDETEEKRDEAIEIAVKRIKEAEMKLKTSTFMSTTTTFLTTIHIGNREGDTFQTQINSVTTVGDMVEKVATEFALAPARYALYLVLGDSESHRVMSSSESLLAAMCSAGTDSFLCLKPNTFADTLKQYMDEPFEYVQLHVREKKRWKKYPCSMRGIYFVQYKDAKCHSEAYRMGVTEFDVFAGVERRMIDVKNPMPSRYCFWLKAMRSEDSSKYLCADSEQDMLKMIAAIVKAKYPDGLQTPMLPTKPPPPEALGVTRRGTLLNASPRNSPMAGRRDDSVYANVKVSPRSR